MTTSSTRVKISVLAVIAVGAAGAALYYRGKAIEAGANWSAETARVRELRAELFAASAPPQAPPPIKAPAFPERSSQALSSNAMTDLKRQVGDLQAALAARDQALASLRQAATNDSPEPWRRREDWLEKLKTEDPAQYEEIMRQREEARQLVKAGFARKAAHFLERDTAIMNQDQLQQYNLMLQLLDETWKLTDQLRAENLPREQRREVMREVRDNVRALSPMLDAERDKELYSLATDLGYNESDASAFVTYVTNILDVTSMRSMFQGGQGWWGGTNR
jgi:hypothetical protein